MFKPIFITIFVFVASGAVKVFSQVTPCGAVNNSNSVSVRIVADARESPQIRVKPQVVFPSALRFKPVIGTVSVKVTFLASGKIGKITVFRGLQKDLDAAVVKTARKIKFVPVSRNGRRLTVIKIVDFDFYDRRRCLPLEKREN